MDIEKKLIIKGVSYKQLFSRGEILRRVDELARQIADDYKNVTQSPILLFVLTGGLYLGVDLSRALEKIDFKYSVDTVGLKRYSGDEKGGLVQILSLPHANLGNRDLVVVEDIIDNGATMNFLNKYLKNLETPPKSIQYCTLLLKENHEPLEFDIKFLGGVIGPKWIVGNGMDSDQSYRGLIDIYEKE
ncbi:MAG: phosphoribosyltransferase family protein [Patescibacteria group bacterium]|jgi:hypoxanthine phosphoribosyltransferase